MARQGDAAGGRPAWPDVHRRLERVRQGLEGSSTVSPAETANVLRARAQALARAPDADGAPTGQLHVLEFLLAQETYGLELEYVREVYPLRDLTPVPCTPAFVLGIASVRGRILPVIDLKKLFELPDRGLADFNKLIVLARDGTEFGILADVVVGVRLLPLGQVQPRLPTLTEIREQYLKGVTSAGMVVLDGGKILSDPRLVVHEGENRP